MLQLRHASHWRHFLRTNSSTLRCSYASGTHRPPAQRSERLKTQPKPSIKSDGRSQGDETSSKTQYDGRQRLSTFWAPTGGIEATADAKDDSHSLLIRGGFIRQAHAGVFQFLPLGLRIQEKLEKLLDKHMTRLGASKVSLSTISSQDLWRKSGRMSEDASSSPAIFQIQDRREGKYILSPTHEEEITSLVGSIVNSYKDLPLRLYQITRKYRDEARPRQGLFRTREFLMKDLYTFDATLESALESYHTTRRAYSEFFDDFKLPYLVAQAASGDMGGDLSHEFHFLTTKGEDNIVSCGACDYAANEELAEVRRPKGLGKYVSGPYEKSKYQFAMLDFASRPQKAENDEDNYRQWYGYSTDGQTMVQVIYPTKKALLAAGIDAIQESRINPSIVQQEFPDLDLSIENPKGDPMNRTRIYRIYDATILPPSAIHDEIVEDYCLWPPESPNPSPLGPVIRRLKQPFVSSTEQHLPVYEVQPGSEKRRNLLKIVDGDPCAYCKDGRLQVRKAVELGHTFHLGTRYTKPLNATVAIDPTRRELGTKFVFDKDEDGKAENDDGVENRDNCGNSDNGEDESGINIEKNEVSNFSGIGIDHNYMQMGCHGIGVSRLIAAVADALADSKGLNWPRVMAPFEVVVVPAKSIDFGVQARVYDALAYPGQRSSAVDTILDDRQRDFGWKLKDADMIGYPIIVIIGRGWSDQKCEVQCRRLKIIKEVPLRNLNYFVVGLLDKL